MSEPLSIHFWGVRGSIPCPGIHTVRYGGNTPCVEIKAGQQRLILDGGTGLRVLGQQMMTNLPVAAHLFFSHTHWDHIQGFPFFEPAFIGGNQFHIYSVPDPEGRGIQCRLQAQMLHPNFPVPLQIMRGDLQFHDLNPGQTVVLGDGLDEVQVTNAPLNHPGGSVGYRVGWQGRNISYITDTEHLSNGQLDQNALRLAEHSDVMIYDATYTNAEYLDPRHSKVGWGHSTWQEAVRLAQAAEVKQLVLFHHDPSHNDDFLDQVGFEAEQVFANSLVAREGLTLELLPIREVVDLAQPVALSERY